MHNQALQRIGRRRDSRLRLHIPARLDTIHGALPVALLDLSQSGAHLFTCKAIGKTGDAMLFWLHFEAFGRIVWASDTQAGLEFDELLLPATLLTTRDIAEHRTPQADRRMAFEAARAWYNGYG